MAFKIVFTEKGLESFRASIDYILYELNNPMAAQNMYLDAMNSLKALEVNANSYNFCEDENFRALGIRKIHLKKYSYKILYHVKDSKVFIDVILHDKQDVESALR